MIKHFTNPAAWNAPQPAGDHIIEGSLRLLPKVAPLALLEKQRINGLIFRLIFSSGNCFVINIILLLEVYRYESRIPCKTLKRWYKFHAVDKRVAFA
jgi:hypothetical protein